MSGFRFQKRLRIAPGVRLNLSRSGPSMSFGGHGLHYTVGRHGRRTTLSLPGTGLSYTTYSHRHARHAAGSTTVRRAAAPRARGQAAPPDAHPLRDLFGMVPSHKIAWGLVLTLLVVTAPIGVPLLVTGLVQVNQPTWKARALIHRASRASTADQARARLDRAAVLAPGSPEVLGPLAEWSYAHQDWPEAARRYGEYCARVPADWVARAHLGKSLLEAGRYDEAITALVAVRGSGALDDESHGSVTAHLALAFLEKHNVVQASELVRAEPLQRHTLGSGLQQCLYLRGITAYVQGQRARGQQDLARLWTMAPAFAGLAEAQAAMNAGTFTFRLHDGSVLG